MRIIRAAVLVGLLASLAGTSVLAEPMAQAPGNRVPSPTPLVPVATPTRPIPTATRAAEGPTPTVTSDVPAVRIDPASLRAAPALPSVPVPPNARALLDSTSSAMDKVTSMRFNGSMDLAVEAEGLSYAMTIPMTGEYQAPDRVHTLVELRSLGFSSETISIGSLAWSRGAAGDVWSQDTSSQFGTPINPAQMSKLNAAQMAGFLLDPALTESGSAYQLASDMDMARALAPGSGAPIFGEDMMDTSFLDLDAATGQLSLTIDKTTRFIQGMEMTMVLPVKEPAGSIGIRLDLSFTDFNNPTIAVNPPTS